jgi:RNA polymerase sigma-70 factor (ECF subfamily)
MNEAAFDAFYDASFRSLVGQVYAMCGDLQEAQDCVQEAFVRAWDKRRTLDLDGAPEAWVRTTAYRLAVSRWRRTKLALRPADPSRRPLPPAEPDVNRVALERALRNISADQRRAVVLYHLCDLSIAEVAEEMGAPTGTVKAWLARGRAALARQLSDEPIEEHQHG